MIRLDINQTVNSNLNSLDKKNKERILGVRFDAETRKQIEEFSEKYQVSKSDFTRTAIHNYLSLFEEQDSVKNPKMILSQNLFKFALENMEESELEGLAEQSYRNGLIFGNFWKQKLKFNQTTENHEHFKRDWLTFLLTHLNKQVFSNEGMNWFESTKLTRSKTTVNFSGSHNLGKNFSIFITFLLKKYIASRNYKMKSIELTNNDVSLKIVPL
jgi:hypothetical protein